MTRNKTLKPMMTRHESGVSRERSLGRNSSNLGWEKKWEKRQEDTNLWMGLHLYSVQKSWEYLRRDNFSNKSWLDWNWRANGWPGLCWVLWSKWIPSVMTANLLILLILVFSLLVKSRMWHKKWNLLFLQDSYEKHKGMKRSKIVRSFYNTTVL